VRRRDAHAVDVEKIMSRNVVTASPETPLKDVARLLCDNNISGLPVVGADGAVVGVVSEADILWKEIGLAEPPRGLVDWILEHAYGDDTRTRATTAGEAMSSPALTISPGDSVTHAAELMAERFVNRLPVVENGRLVGIVARADLVRAFKRSDEEIEREISEEVLRGALCVDPDTVSLAIAGGRVSLAGTVENRSTARLVEALVRRVPGVVSVRSQLQWEIDDGARRTRASADHLPRRMTP